MATLPETKFLADGMLGSISRKLRIIGFDTMYYSDLDDSQLLADAANSRRILLTSDIELYLRAKRKGIQTIRVSSKTEQGRLYEILAGIGETKIDLDPKGSRCSVCNGILLDLGKLQEGKKVFSCNSCGKDYWKGGHWKKLTKLFSEVNLFLKNGKWNFGNNEH